MYYLIVLKVQVLSHFVFPRDFKAAPLHRWRDWGREVPCFSLHFVHKQKQAVMHTWIHTYIPLATMELKITSLKMKISSYRSLDISLLYLPCSNDKWAIFYQLALYSVPYIRILSYGTWDFILFGSLPNLITFLWGCIFSPPSKEKTISDVGWEENDSTLVCPNLILSSCILMLCWHFIIYFFVIIF